MNSNNDPSSKYNINLYTGSITTIATNSNASLQVHNSSTDGKAMEGQMLPPESPDVPSSSRSFSAKAKSPGKTKIKETLEKNSEEYLRRRQRNNVAVKKSREKMREKTVYTLQKVEQLKMENEQLETKISILTKELSVLKDLFMDHAKGFCAGGNVDLMSPEKLETLLGCKVIRSNYNQNPVTEVAVPENSSLQSSSNVPDSPIQPLINAAEIELMPLTKTTVTATVIESDISDGENIDNMLSTSSSLTKNDS